MSECFQQEDFDWSTIDTTYGFLEIKKSLNDIVRSQYPTRKYSLIELEDGTYKVCERRERTIFEVHFHGKEVKFGNYELKRFVEMTNSLPIMMAYIAHLEKEIHKLKELE